MDSLAKSLGTVLFALFLIVVLGAYHAVAVMLLWGWFIVPLGLPDIGMAHSYGLILFGTMFRTPPDPDKKNGGAILLPAICILLGYIVKFWV